MEETGVPASVILAVAIHESAYGNSRIARHLNNHFGIKGKNQSKTIRSAYKGYDTPLDSYRDFVGLLKRRKATQPLFEQHSSTDYQAWLLGIARSGYCIYDEIFLGNLAPFFRIIFLWYSAWHGIIQPQIAVE